MTSRKEWPVPTWKIVSANGGTTRDLLAETSLVCLKGFDRYPIYKKADISMWRGMAPFVLLMPAQNYVHRRELKKIWYLRLCLLERGFDIFKLNGVLTYVIEFEDGTQRSATIIPPVVEETIEDNGSRVMTINDGLHRCYLAGLQFSNVDVLGVRLHHTERLKYPYYAYPNASSWDGVEELDELPADYEKKLYRTTHHRDYYRDFDAVFGNMSTHRPRDKSS